MQDSQLSFTKGRPCQASGGWISGVMPLVEKGRGN